MRTFPLVSMASLCLASCTVAPRSTSTSAVTPAPEPLASAVVSPSPWPASTSVASPTLRTQTRPLPHDMAQIRGLRGIAISPDGARVAYIVRSPTFDPAAKPSDDDTKGGWKVDQQLFVVDRAGGPQRQLTFGDDPVTQVRFSPDSKRLAFVRKKGKRQALHVLELDGGEPRVVTLGAYELKTYDWAPDGKAFTFTAERPGTDDGKAEQWRRGGADLYEEFEQTHLFVVPVAGGEPRHVNPGSDTVNAYAWSPDGKRIALVLLKTADPVDAFQRVVVMPAAGGAVTELDRGDGKTPFLVTKLAWSPDSKRLAYSLTARGGLSHIDELRVRTVDSDRVVDAAARLDLEITGFVWSGDGRSLLTTALARTVSRLYRLPAAGGAAKEIPIGKRVLFSLEGDRAGRYLVAASSTPTMAANPTVIDVERGTARPITSINPQLAAWTIVPKQLVSWKNREGVALDGLLTVTSHVTAGAPPPLIVLPHGGPDGVTVETFDGWPQFFAARGYSVFEPNYRGGTGYGRAFYESNRGKLGEIELADIEPGVDALIAAGKADRGRLFYAGWSWGGYLSAYTLGHTDRYRAFMVGAGVSDTVVQYVTSDINHGPAADWEFKGRPFNQPDAFSRPNPALSFARAKAPTLIMHGREDSRVPFVNAQVLYRALSDRNVPVTFWAYPREPHGFQEPAHVQHLMETWAAFFDQQLAAKPTQ
ncbi:MAG: prolyl oligopeptidase family serine peptidase [Kofleriaceae bacterium]